MEDKWTKADGENRILEIQKVNELIKSIRFGMFTTISEDQSLHSRPMAAQQLDENNCLWFLTSNQSGKIKAIAHDKDVNVSFSAIEKNDYLSLAGRAEVLVDRNKMEELWNPAYLAWFPKGLEDPELCLIKVTVKSAEFWDSPNSKIVYFVGLAKAIATGQPYKASQAEHGRVQLN